jgi:hypothetical protein
MEMIQPELFPLRGIPIGRGCYFLLGVEKTESRGGKKGGIFEGRLHPCPRPFPEGKGRGGTHLRPADPEPDAPENLAGFQVADGVKVTRKGDQIRRVGFVL